MKYPYKCQFYHCLKSLGRQSFDRYLSTPQNNGQYGIYSYCLNQVTFRWEAYVLKVWLDGLCTEGGEQQPSPLKLVCPDRSVSKMVCFRTGYRCHAGLSCTSDKYPPARYLWIVDCHGFRWFHRVFPGHMAETYTGFPPRQDNPSCNTHTMRCYAPVICNHVPYGPDEQRGF